jgi:hypothetical protein
MMKRRLALKGIEGLFSAPLFHEDAHAAEPGKAVLCIAHLTG